MLKEVFISPQVFTEPTINRYSLKDVKFLLENLKMSGYLVGIGKHKWRRDVRSRISRLDKSFQDKLNNLITILHKRNRIVDFPIQDNTISDESEWLELVLQLHEQRNLYSIFATHSGKNILSLESLDDVDIPEEYGLSGSKRIKLSENNMGEILLPFLSYAKKLTIVDPFFYVNNQNTKTSLELIASMLGERRGNQLKGSIDIHCRWDWNAKPKPNRREWPKIIKKIHDDYGHSICIKTWEQQPGDIRIHDRYLITNQGGLVSAAGTSIDAFKNSEWSIKDYGELAAVKDDYKDNSSPFELEDTISVG
jgi:hypothetical protein